MAEISFNAQDVAPQQEFDLLPAGKYLAQVIDSEIKPTKSGTGQVLKLTFEVLDGEFSRRRVWSYLNIANENADAERIGLSQLSALCHAVGVMQLTDSVQLHDKPVQITVKVRKAKPGSDYGDSNDVSGFSSASGAAPSGVARPAAAAQSKPSASVPPWQKRAAA